MWKDLSPNIKAMLILWAIIGVAMIVVTITYNP